MNIRSFLIIFAMSSLLHSEESFGIVVHGGAGVMSGLSEERQQEIHKKIQESDIPVYTIWGDSDKVVVYHEFEKRIDSLMPKRKEFFILDSGHLPHMENPEQFNRILLSIIK